MQTVKKLPLKPYISKTGFAKVNWVFGESSKARMITLMLLNPFFWGCEMIWPVPNIVCIGNNMVWEIKNNKLL